MLSRLCVNAGRKLLLSASINSQKIVKCKFSHLTLHTTSISSRNNCAFNFHKHFKIIGICSVRHQSTVDTTKEAVSNTQTDSSVSDIQEVAANTSDTVTDKVFISELPEIPVPQTQEIIETIVKLHPNGEPTLESIGLGGYTPVGLVQSALEWIHISCNMPWWSTIMIGTVICRTLLVPLVIKTQRHTAMYRNNLPEMEKLQTKMTEARQCGNDYEAAMHAQDLMKFMSKKSVNPLKCFTVTAIQMPVFVSFFLALKKMANTPVESLKEGGLWWFTDLTLADPYYTLPLITSVTFFVTTEFSILGAAGPNGMGIVKYIFRFIPIIMFPFIMNFPAAILCYWVSTNLFTLLQVTFLRIEKVRRFFDIPIEVKKTTPKRPLKLENIKAGIENSWSNIKVTRKLADHLRADAIQFNEAGKAPLKKTFKYNPIKNPPTATKILTKNR
ncbi:mitochondrial inner membrane protein OXA1L [Hylaeus volcanicus]|uniref:mitochondrial inner membrane protein OXA1L n=1 Tax=Hylaeus volcanicus TaxID=313075 RepID=UPI0023B77D51|nr:mitochondrial inner membrane protein OXA1L [Hylaeus volcanicus]